MSCSTRSSTPWINWGRSSPADKVIWDAEPTIRLAIERLWITAGNVAETYRRDVLDLDPGVEPWSELVAYRNKLAHALPGDLSTDRVYADSRADPVRLLARIRDERP